MGMNKPQAFKPGRGRAVGVKIGNHDAFMIPEDDDDNFTLAVDEKPDLPIEFTG
jgi:hypothetical protein